VHKANNYSANYTKIEATVNRMARNGKCDEIWNYTFPMALKGSDEAAKVLFSALHGIKVLSGSKYLRLIPPFERVPNERNGGRLTWDFDKNSELNNTLAIQIMKLELTDALQGQVELYNMSINYHIKNSRAKAQNKHNKLFLECDLSQLDRDRCQNSLVASGVVKRLDHFIIDTIGNKAGCLSRIY